MIIRLEVEIARPAEAVFAFLADLDNHWRVAGRRVVPAYRLRSPTEATVRFGPPGFRRWADTSIDRTEPPRFIEGSAVSGESDGTTRWRLEPRGADRTHVRFEQELRPRGLRDRLALATAGRIWLPRQYAGVLRRLKGLLEQEA